MTESFHALFDAAPPERRCIVSADGTALSYGAIGARSRRIASGLAGLGIRRGDAVALWMANGPDWLASFVACTRLGAMAVGVNARFRGREIGAMLRRTGARILVADLWQGNEQSREIFATIPAPDLDSLAAIIVTATPDDAAWGRHDLAALGQMQAHDAPVEAGTPDDSCIVFTTSGTTRAPKLVVHRQRGVVAHARDVAAAFQLDQDSSCVLQIVPFGGAFGFAQMIGAIAAACPLVAPSVLEPSQAAHLLRDERVTNMVGANDMLDRMLAARTEVSPFPSLRFFGHANFNPALPDLPQRAASRGVKLRGLFGMSETLALFAMQPDDAALDRRGASGGVPISPQARARVRDVASGAIAAPGVNGEIELRGPSLMSGYLDDDAQTRAAFTADGFLRTGDLGYATDDGGFIHLGRMGDVLRLGGYLVNPLEIEETILENDELRACQVVEAQRDGQARPVAFVLRADAAVVDEAKIIAHCRARLAAFKVPIRVLVLDAFPTVDGPNGVKIRRDELRQLAQSHARI